jgi:uncharacterized protein (DUF342 family)
MTEFDFSNNNKLVTLEESTQKTSQRLSSLQEFIEATAKANGVSTQEAAAALEDNGWDVIIMEQLHNKQ